jgi:hypothetical protein
MGEKTEDASQKPEAGSAGERVERTVKMLVLLGGLAPTIEAWRQWKTAGDVPLACGRALAYWMEQACQMSPNLVLEVSQFAHDLGADMTFIEIPMSSGMVQ